MFTSLQIISELLDFRLCVITASLKNSQKNYFIHLNKKIYTIGLNEEVTATWPK